ncbi:MAG: metalloregulator ArsR/SmtB family transcription factor [Leadbetterella sp.]|nr:metalloregulator ArsR/SmtB family transcription factor [Leadbetterella sp.]
MGITKSDSFSGHQNKVSLLFKALGHPARIAILEYLMRVDTCMCGDIVSELPLAQPTVSQHLKELKNAGIIKGNISGNSICYCIDEGVITKLRDYLAVVQNAVINQKQNCC